MTLRGQGQRPMALMLSSSMPMMTMLLVAPGVRLVILTPASYAMVSNFSSSPTCARLPARNISPMSRAMNQSSL